MSTGMTQYFHIGNNSFPCSHTREMVEGARRRANVFSPFLPGRADAGPGRLPPRTPVALGHTTGMSVGGISGKHRDEGGARRGLSRFGPATQATMSTTLVDN